MVSVAVNKILLECLMQSLKFGQILKKNKEMGRACSKVVLIIVIGNSRDSVKLGNLSR